MCIRGGIDMYFKAHHMRLVIWNMQVKLENLEGWEEHEGTL